eukprot:scaffold20979_cov80-Skeletonema_menzelii.AAC.1
MEMQKARLMEMNSVQMMEMQMVMSLVHLSAAQTAMQMALMSEKHWVKLMVQLKEMSLACLWDCWT